MASKKGKILVVDDNAGILQALKILLPMHFAEVETIASPVTLVKRGAFDFIVKPWDNEKLIATLTAARDKARKAMGLDDRRKEKEEPMFWGASRQMALIRNTVQKIAPTDASVLITGENGTGKDVLAREIHAMSLRNRKPMVAVDAGASPRRSSRVNSSAT